MSFDFDAAVTAPFRMQPGLRRLPPAAPQLTPMLDAAGTPRPHWHEKLDVLCGHPAQALLQRDGFDAVPALAALAAQAAREHPAHCAWEGGRFASLGWSVDAAGHIERHRDDRPEAGATLARLEPRWRLAALLGLALAEDFAIVDARDATIPWLAVALPSGWAPAEKVGRPFGEVHAPVADNRLVVQAGPALLRLVTGDERWERFVWTISPHGRLDGHPARGALPPGERWPAHLDADALVAQAWWRTERQTFIPLPALGQAVFTILVDVQPLTAAIDTPARAARVHAALASMSQAVLAYRGLAAAQARLLDWLARRAAG